MSRAPDTQIGRESKGKNWIFAWSHPDLCIATGGILQFSMTNPLARRTENLQRTNQSEYHNRAMPEQTNADVVSSKGQAKKIKSLNYSTLPMTLTIADRGNLEELTWAIETAHSDVVEERLGRSLRRSPKGHQARVSELRDHLIRAHSSFRQLAAEHAVAIGECASPSQDGEPFDIVGAEDYLARFAKGIFVFFKDFEPPRG